MAMNTPVSSARLQSAGPGWLDAHAGDAGLVAQYFIQRVIPLDGDLAGLLALEQLVLHDFFGAELVTPMDHV
jgi:hypothetical protein